MCVYIQLYEKMPQSNLRVLLEVYVKKKKKESLEAHNYFIRKSRLSHLSIIYYL